VCYLASIALPKFIKNQVFDHLLLFKVTRIITRNLDLIIDKNNFPPTGDDLFDIKIPHDILSSNDIGKIKEFFQELKNNPKKYIESLNRAALSSQRQRNIGIGIQGLADVYILLGLAFDSLEAAKLNIEIFETMYYASLFESVQLARENGYHETYPGSPLSMGIYQFHYCGVKPSSRWDWDKLEQDRKIYGVRNSLLIAPMPTKTTSHILGNNEAFGRKLLYLI